MGSGGPELRGVPAGTEGLLGALLQQQEVPACRQGPSHNPSLGLEWVVLPGRRGEGWPHQGARLCPAGWGAVACEGAGRSHQSNYVALRGGANVEAQARGGLDPGIYGLERLFCADTQVKGGPGVVDVLEIAPNVSHLHDGVTPAHWMKGPILLVWPGLSGGQRTGSAVAGSLRGSTSSRPCRSAVLRATKALPRRGDLCGPTKKQTSPRPRGVSGWGACRSVGNADWWGVNTICVKTVRGQPWRSLTTHMDARAFPCWDRGERLGV